MSTLLQHMTPPPIEHFGGGHDAYELKFGSVVRRISREADLEGLRAVIVGFPTDEGVRRNHGRPGAAAGPASIRRMFYRLNATTAFRQGVDMDQVGDLGNVEPGRDLEESQQRLGAVVTDLLARGLTLVVLGGGHETAYGHALGHIASRENFSFYNIDPHLDVRNPAEGKANSGNPFRLALDASEGKMRYVCLGARAAVNAPAYADYVIEQGGTIRWEPAGAPFDVTKAFREELAFEPRARVAVSLDVDAVSSAFAPGSSAASPFGLGPAEFVEVAAAAGRDRRVRSIEISEFAPNLDRDYQTERLCALCVQSFLIARFSTL